MRQELKTNIEAVDAKEAWARAQFNDFMNTWREATKDLKALEYLELGVREFYHNGWEVRQRVWLSYNDHTVCFQDVTDEDGHARNEDYYSADVAKSRKDYLSMDVITFVLVNFQGALKKYMEQNRKKIDWMSRIGNLATDFTAIIKGK